MPPMTAATARRVVALTLAATVLLASACGSTVSPGPSQTPGSTVGPATATATPTPEPAFFPLALIARFTDLRDSLDQDELASAVNSGDVLVPCGLEDLELGDESLTLPDPGACLTPAKIVAKVRAKSGPLGLVPVDAVTPAVKVLRVGDADLFGSPSRRANPYPVIGLSSAFGAQSVAYDAAEVRTAVTPLNWCPDRGVAQQLAKMGESWDWILDGGTARYTGTHIDHTFTGRGGASGWTVVDAVPGSDHGKVRALMRDADLTIADVRCPIVKNYRPATGHSTVFSLDPKIVSLLTGASVDVVGLASNHIYDHGRTGLSQTIGYLDAAGLPHTGAGLDLAAALEPAVVDVRGLRFAFVGFDSTIGAPNAGPDNAGVADLNLKNLDAAITKAKAEADLVIALPVWNWPEYWAHFTQASLRQRDQMFDLGVTAILGDGTHWAGALSLDQGPDGPRLAVATHGNFLFDQDWSRQTQEGVLYELTFYGKRLAQVRLHPYIILMHGQPNLTDPRTDGAYVLKQVFNESIFDLP
jgi:poly-gamma-glutamate capsule biosynthesis protein CapA/YwtB (metallophosphatase superfamily)